MSEISKDVNLAQTLELMSKLDDTYVDNKRDYERALKVFGALDQIFLHEEDYDPKQIEQFKGWVMLIVGELVSYNPDFEYVLEKNFPNVDIATSLDVFPELEKMGTNGVTDQALRKVMPAAERYLSGSEGIHPKYIAKLRELISTSKVVRKFVEDHPCYCLPQVSACIKNATPSKIAKQDAGLEM